MTIEAKTAKAKKVIKKCRAKDGFYASADVYCGQYWTRDLALSLDVLLNLGYSKPVLKHLTMIKQRQTKSGAIPTIIFDMEKVPVVIYKVAGILYEYLSDKNIDYSLLDTNIKNHITEWISGYHSWVGDNETLFVISLLSLSRKGVISLNEWERPMKKAIKFVESGTDKNLGLISGSGWTDLMMNYRNKQTFLVNLLRYRMWRFIDREKAKSIRKTINSLYWDKEKNHYRNFIGGDRFDTFAHALALEWRLVPKEKINLVAEKFDGLLTKGGYKNIDIPYPKNECGMSPHFFQNSAPSPFLDARVIAVLKKLGFDNEAKRGFRILSEKKTFSEWYSIDGKLKGSKDQLWSATGWLMIKDLF